MLNENASPEVMDAGLIVALQKVEHYEIAGYGSCVAFAKLLGNAEAAGLLGKTLEEEMAADQRMTQIAQKSVNLRANQ